MNLERTAAVIGGVFLISLGVYQMQSTAGYTAGFIIGFVFVAQGLYGNVEPKDKSDG